MVFMRLKQMETQYDEADPKDRWLQNTWTEFEIPELPDIQEEVVQTQTFGLRRQNNVQDGSHG